MKLTSLSVASLAMLSAPAFAGDIDVVFVGTLEFAQAGTASPAALAGLAEGDAVSVTTSVFSPGTPSTSSPGTSYAIDPAACSISTSLGVIAGDVAAAAGTVELIDGALDPMDPFSLNDLIFAQQTFDGGVNVGAAAAWVDTWFPNEDLASQAGTIYDLTFQGSAQIIGLSIDDPSGGFYFFRITEVQILAQSGLTFQTKYCPAVANSTGVAARLRADGSPFVQDNDLQLQVDQLPLNSFGIFAVGTERDFVAAPGGSQGNLCLGGELGRFQRPGEIMNSGMAGTVSIDLNLNDIPTSVGSTSIVPGDTMRFGYWYRDVNPQVTSNFSDAVEITFL